MFPYPQAILLRCWAAMASINRPCQLVVVLGGLGHIWSGIIGAIIMYDFTKDYSHYPLLTFGSVIVLTVLFMPKGVGGIIDRFVITRRFLALRKAMQG